MIKRINKYIIFSLLIALFGQVYFFPFSSSFKFSLSVIFLAVILLYMEDLNVFILSNTVGIMIFVLRSLPMVFNGTNVNFMEAFYVNFPSVVYYFIYAFLFYILDIRDKVNKNYFNLILLVIIDTLSNISEILIRQDIESIAFEVVLLTFVIVAILRTIIASIFVYIFEKNKIEHKKQKVMDLLFLNASLDSELFYLKKSTHDIENTMNLSYNLYEKIDDPTLKREALEISKNIHEIKKDYNRVIDGIEINLNKIDKYTMGIEEAKEIIENNCVKQINKTGKDISIIFSIKDDFKVTKYHSLFTVLNNLIINAIEAIPEEGYIKVVEFTENDNYIFRVRDNGQGIKTEDLEVIFEPGYTTKFNQATGKMSQGIGLRHVKDIVENIFNGSIEAESKVGDYTNFIIKIPKKNI